MITLSTLFTLAGFECFYQTSGKAVILRPAALEAWFISNVKLAKTLGPIFLVIGLICSILALGIGSGSFAFLCILMTIGSLVVLISPLVQIKADWLLIGFGLLFILELF
tara:strand:- start:14148 stop:14474 length:327 start_codon:yes stop_codon:yes gene_type:complete